MSLARRAAGHPSRLRLALVIAVPTLCMCAASRRQAKTTFAVTSSDSIGEHRTYGCLGEITGSAYHRLQAASVAVEHDTGGYVVGGAAVAAASDVVQATSGLLQDVDRSASTIGAASAWLGLQTNESAADIGATVLSPRLVTPYAAIRAGYFKGFYGEIKVGSRQPLIDFNKVGFYGHWRSGNAHFSAGLGWLTPNVAERTYPKVTDTTGEHYGALQSAKLVTAEPRDLGLRFSGEHWPSADVGIGYAVQVGSFVQVAVTLMVGRVASPAGPKP